MRRPRSELRRRAGSGRWHRSFIQRVRSDLMPTSDTAKDFNRKCIQLVMDQAELPSVLDTGITVGSI